MRFTDFRIKVRRFLRNNGKLIFIIFLIWAIAFAINLYFKYRPEVIEPETTYEPHVSIMDSGSKVSKRIGTTIEEMIAEYVGYCNEGNYYAAFNMLSDDCKKHEFNDNIETFMKHVLMKMPTPKEYSIQDYSNIKVDGLDVYIYAVKYFDDYLATGLTNSEYMYTTEKLTFYNEGTELKMSAGNFIFHDEVKNITENEYLKIDVLEKSVNYSIETYKVKFTNRSDYTVVIADNFEADEIQLKLPNETRERADRSEDIVLAPKDTLTASFTFSKFVDDGDTSEGLNFSNIRILEKYSGSEADEAILKEEVNNAIHKMSMQVIF